MVVTEFIHEETLDIILTKNYNERYQLASYMNAPANSICQYPDFLKQEAKTVKHVNNAILET